MVFAFFVHDTIFYFARELSLLAGVSAVTGGKMVLFALVRFEGSINFAVFFIRVKGVLKSKFFLFGSFGGEEF